MPSYVINGLKDIHEEGLTHRDLKQSNILSGVKILYDFGVIHRDLRRNSKKVENNERTEKG
jgi:serine/threonine protein kinase